ncbi:hypothetical protein DPMN_041468 [Dreissena polymorpha]|uniref:Uncharacterized protein n=1 Tax=Dreissena polymorpha TaxID=45954 RepID=A0A9D4HW84_DREPO|nr:hypothetical protein DPMN_041468 [Dreissena polymorpha]
MDESDIDKMNMDAAFEWLEKMEICHKLNSLDEMKDLIRKTLKAQPDQFSQQFKDTARMTISKNCVL